MLGFFFLSLSEKLLASSRKRELSKLIALLDPKKDDVILDVGAGTGWMAEEVAKHSDEVYALEPEEKRVEYIKQNHPEVKAFSAFANSIPFPQNYFDKLYVARAFHHFPDQEDALEEFRRVIKKGGALLIQDANGRGFALSLERKFLGGEKVRFLSSEELDSMARRHEFATVEVARGKKDSDPYFVLCKNEKTGEHASGWLGDERDVKEEKRAMSSSFG